MMSMAMSTDSIKSRNHAIALISVDLRLFAGGFGAAACVSVVGSLMRDALGRVEELVFQLTGERQSAADSLKSSQSV